MQNQYSYFQNLQIWTFLPLLCSQSICLLFFLLPHLYHKSPSARCILCQLGKCNALPTGHSPLHGPPSSLLHTAARVNCKSDCAISLPETIQWFPLVLRLMTNISRKAARPARSGPLFSLQAHLPVLSHFLHSIGHSGHLLFIESDMPPPPWACTYAVPFLTGSSFHPFLLFLIVQPSVKTSHP